MLAGVQLHAVVRSAKAGWAVGKAGGQIYITGDGGLTWTPHKLPATETLYGISLGGGLGRAVGEGGIVLRSTDKDHKVWSRITAPTKATLRDLVILDGAAPHAWAVGDGGVVIYSADAGKSWVPQSTHQTARLNGICFTSAKEGWIVGAGGVVLQNSAGGV